MKVYGVEFKITEEHVNKQKIVVVPGEGVIMPLDIERICGFHEYLIRNKCIRKNKLDMIYIYLISETWDGVLCVKYSDGDVSVIQHLGLIDIYHSYIE